MTEVNLGFESPLNGIYRLTDSQKDIKYKHLSNEFYISKSKSTIMIKSFMESKTF